ncbi:hypothetical protein ZWY2020_020467 [Hordeum vulgare]|nr:hypothetical protein ZWY2020_020467 [Hordeum vulgare]
MQFPLALPQLAESVVASLPSRPATPRCCARSPPRAPSVAARAHSLLRSTACALPPYSGPPCALPRRHLIGTCPRPAPTAYYNGAASYAPAAHCWASAGGGEDGQGEKGGIFTGCRQLLQGPAGPVRAAACSAGVDRQSLPRARHPHGRLRRRQGHPEATTRSLRDGRHGKAVRGQELAALRRVKGHPHVMRLLDVLASRSTVYLVLELARGGPPVRDGRTRPFRRAHGAPPVRQLVSALAHVHSVACSTDVKPENLLLDEHGDLKLTDFGLCTLAGRHLGADGLAATRCGSPAYVAPEILYRSDLLRQIPVPEVVLAGLRCLIGRMLDPNPDTRIKIGEIMEHPWLQQDGTSSFANIIRAGSSDPRPEVMKWEAEMEQKVWTLGRCWIRRRDWARGGVCDEEEEVGCGGVMFEAIRKEIIALVRVSRLLEEMLVVEVERASSVRHLNCGRCFS